MADNTAQNGTATIATDGIVTLNGGTVAEVQAQRVKVGFGSDSVFRDVDAANGLPVVQTGNSLVSTVNSTATALAANGVFTGTAEDVSEYSTIIVTVFADQASATDGLSVQQSTNGTNWDVTDVYSIPINNGKTFSFGVQAKFMRVVYTNGATASTVLRLQTIHSKAMKIGSSVRPQDGRTNDNDFEEVLSYGMVYDSGLNTWHRMRGNSTTGVLTSLSSIVSLTTLSAANTAVTLTLPAVAGQFHYITRIRITAHNTTATAVAGSAVTLAFTSTNIPTGLAWTAGNALGAGVDKIVTDEQLQNPLKSTTVNTATTIVAPACGTGVLVRITAYYYTAA